MNWNPIHYPIISFHICRWRRLETADGFSQTYNSYTYLPLSSVRPLVLSQRRLLKPTPTKGGCDSLHGNIWERVYELLRSQPVEG